MQKSTLVSCLLLINFAFSSAVFLQKPSQKQFQIFSSLQKVEQIDFGKRILDTIALQLTNKVPLAEVAKVLSQLKDDLDRQQADADTQHANDEANCRSENERLDNNINNAANIRDSSTEALQVLRSEISNLQSSLQSIENQLHQLEDRLNSYKQARDRDNKNYQQRRAETTQVLEALDLIIDRLQTIKPEDNQEAFLQLAKIGKSNPILSLVQVAATFSPESLLNVLNKLTALRDSLLASLDNEEKQENVAINNYNNLISELQQTVQNLTNQRSSQTIELAQKQSAREFHERRLDEAIAEHQFNTEEKERLNAQCDSQRAVYSRNTEVRTSEILTVVQVQNILATKLETMRDYLKQRAEADQ